MLDSFWGSLLAHIIGVSVGAIVGIPAALYVNRRITHGESRRQREQMRRALKVAIGRNLGNLANDKLHIDDSGVVPSGVDLALLQATASSKYDVLGDILLCAKIDEVRFHLEHVGRHLDELLRLDSDSTARVARVSVGGNEQSFYEYRRPQLAGIIKSHIATLEDEGRQVWSRLDKVPSTQPAPAGAVQT
jgi:hypothetical protein